MENKALRVSPPTMSGSSGPLAPKAVEAAVEAARQREQAERERRRSTRQKDEIGYTIIIKRRINYIRAAAEIVNKEIIYIK